MCGFKGQVYVYLFVTKSYKYFFKGKFIFRLLVLVYVLSG